MWISSSPPQPALLRLPPFSSQFHVPLFFITHWSQSVLSICTQARSDPLEQGRPARGHAPLPPTEATNSASARGRGLVSPPHQRWNFNLSSCGLCPGNKNLELMNATVLRCPEILPTSVVFLQSFHRSFPQCFPSPEQGIWYTSQVGFRVPVTYSPYQLWVSVFSEW